MQNVPNPPFPPMPRPPHLPEPRRRDPARRIVRPDVSRRRDAPDRQIWNRPDMRRFLATHDIGSVYRLLQKYGMSQRAIVARTGHAQSEVAEIIGGRRRVVAYHLLVKIARGLGLRRAWLGLDYDEETRKLLAESAGGEQ